MNSDERSSALLVVREVVIDEIEVRLLVKAATLREQEQDEPEKDHELRHRSLVPEEHNFSPSRAQYVYWLIPALGNITSAFGGEPRAERAAT